MHQTLRLCGQRVCMVYGDWQTFLSSENCTLRVMFLRLATGAGAPAKPPAKPNPKAAKPRAKPLTKSAAKLATQVAAKPAAQPAAESLSAHSCGPC